MSEAPCCVVELTHGRGIGPACAVLSTQILVQICVLVIVAFGVRTMLKDSEYCRWQADECSRKAKWVLPENRDTYLHLQQRWNRYAEQLETEEGQDLMRRRT